VSGRKRKRAKRSGRFQKQAQANEQIGAFEANKRNSIKLPTEYDRFRHMFERRFVDITL
jgi:hypothetical protein